MFALKFDPRIPAIQPMVAKHWRSINAHDKYLGDFFKPYPERKKERNFKFGMSCTACPYRIKTDEKSVNFTRETPGTLRKICHVQHIILYIIYYSVRKTTADKNTLEPLGVS